MLFIFSLERVITEVEGHHARGQHGARQQGQGRLLLRRRGGPAGYDLVIKSALITNKLGINRDNSGHFPWKIT